jgi:hypothetical protein
MISFLQTSPIKEVDEQVRSPHILQAAMSSRSDDRTAKGVIVSLYDNKGSRDSSSLAWSGDVKVRGSTAI